MHIAETIMFHKVVLLFSAYFSLCVESFSFY